MYINNLGHMTKMAAMPIYGKNPSKIIISETNRLISRKLGVRHRWLKYSNVYINHDPVMTLTKFMARSTWVACASELGKLLKCHLKEKANRKLANGQNIEDSEKRKWPKGLSAPALELNTIIFKHVYWYMQLISGERLQDHWSSGLKFREYLMLFFITEFCPDMTKKLLTAMLNLNTDKRCYCSPHHKKDELNSFLSHLDTFLELVKQSDYDAIVLLGKADQHLCFLYTDSIIPLHLKSKISRI